MGRPEPCVLFAQTFVHPQLDEYVDEVIFAEPIVITACEFLEQNATSASPAVTLVGGTSPPSFALEVFVQCEGETRFRRLCQSFLYSHSSSNALEVEAVVTNHLVVRGSYRSLSLVIYGNTAEDLGQFSIEVDLDSSLTNTVFSIEGKLEDLPPALHLTNLTIEELISSPKALSLEVVASDISVEIKQLLELTFKALQLSNLGDAVNKVISSFVSAASSYDTYCWYCPAIGQKQSLEGRSRNCVLAEARKDLLDIYDSLQHKSGNLSAESLADSTFLDSEADVATSKQLMDILSKYFHFDRTSGNPGHRQLSKNKGIILWLSAALLFCSSRESCFHFVNSGGMEQLGHIFCNGMRNSHAITLLLLGVVEQATRNSIGCEGFLGWWPREDESIPSGTSEGYNQLLKLLLQKQPHDVASLATHILQRLRFYEVACRYESAVLSVLGSLSAAGKVTSVTLDKLTNAKFQLKTLMKLITSRGPIEDPSPLACTSRSLLLGETEGLLSYKSTCSLITSSNCWYSNWDIDSHLLFLLKERGFFPLSAALLSSSLLRSEMGRSMDIFVDITSCLQAIILSLLFCRSGLIFLLLHSELFTTVILALRGTDGLRKEEPLPLRYASVLISKGFFCHPEEIGMIVETHLRVVNAIDRLLTSHAHSEEILSVLWELCGLSRSHCGRQALLALGHFPEAVSVLIGALHSIKELDPVTSNSGASPLNLAVFHSAAEIFEIIVADLTASSLGSWIGNATELHRALHSSSPGSNRKDAPTRLLEWIDASIVYHRKGATGLLQYTAVLASGGDAHIASTSILSSDTMDVENIVGDSSTSSDCNLIENLLGKPIFENSYRAGVLRDSSVAQLTTAFRILAFISENPAVAAALYDDGAVVVIHAILIDCKLMLERSSNNYDYLVDEGTEGNSTSDLLLERNREQSLVDLLIPTLVLLINLLQRLQEAKEQHRNTKLMKAILQLHREMSPRLAACAADLSSPYPGSALGFEAVCHLLVSALACWPVYGWTPGIFNFLVDSLHATSLLALGPKEACCLLCLLNDLFPEEGFWLWKNGMPMLSALRTLAVGTLLGPQKEKQIAWYLQPEHLEMLLSQLTPQLDKIAQIILHCAVSTLAVIQDMLRVFIIRIACLNGDHACILLRPIILWIRDRISELSLLPDTDAYKVYRLLDFLAILLEHPRAKPLLLKEGAVQMLIKVLERCITIADSDEQQFCDSRNIAKFGFSQLTFCVPVCKSISLISDSRTSAQYIGMHDRRDLETLTTEDCSRIFLCLLKLCKILPVGRELLACLSTFKELGSCSEGQSALLSIFLHIQSSSTEEYDSDSRHERDGSYNLLNALEWRKSPPLLCCWITLLRSLDSKDDVPDFAIEAVGALSSGALLFCMDGKSLNLDRVVALKYLFGLPSDMSGTDDFPEENIKYVEDLTTLLCSRISDDDYPADSDMNSTLYQVKESAKSLLVLLQKPSGLVKTDDIISGALSSSDVHVSSKMHKRADGSAGKAEDYNLGGLADKFLWECPENLRDRLSQTALPLKRKMPSLEGANRRPRGDNAPSETVVQNAFSTRSGPTIAPSGPSRRDTFRQRKPNTSRPPSMHVDDYVARERNVDGTTSSNVIAVPRVGSSSGRPPSIHVDEFMARQRERQNPVGMAVGDAVAQLKNAPPESDTDADKSNKPRQLKPDLDDDLQGIDIVFDGEESESDDKLPFPQPDDNLPQPTSVVVEQSSHSIVEETEGDVNESSQFSHLGAPLASNVDENTLSEFSSRMSVSHPDMPLTREPSVSSDRKYYEQSDDTKNVPIKTCSGFESDVVPSSSKFSSSVYNKTSVPPVQLPIDSRIPPHLHSNISHQQTGNVPLASGSQRIYDPKFQPPLPPMPPPPTISPVPSQTPDPVPSQSSPFVNAMADLQAPPPTGFHVQKEYLSALSNSSTSMSSSSFVSDSKYGWGSISSPGGSSRPPPPLPPTPPPYSATSTFPSLKPSTSQSSVYNQTSIGTSELLQTSVAPLNDPRIGNLSASGALLTSYPPPPLMPPLLFSRPSTMPVSLYGSSPTPHQGENLPSISQNLSIPLSSIQSMQSLAQLQPLQPPQILRPPQPPQHLRPPIPASPQSEQGGASLLQSPVQMPSQMLQQSQVSPLNVYYQQPQQDSFSHPQQLLQQQQQQGEGTSQQEQDSKTLSVCQKPFLSSSEHISAMKKPHKTTTQDSIQHHDRRRRRHHDEGRRRRNHQDHHHDHQELTDTGFTDASDLCQQLLDRYGKSSAPQHRYLCATASATRSIIESESLPLTPLSYFAAAISTVAASDTTSLDSNAVSALSSFLAIVLPLVPKDSIVASKAGDAVGVLVELVDRLGEELATASARSLVKCLGVLLGFCDLEDWDSVKVGFGTLLKFSIDRRPKVRKCAQDCVVKVFKSFESSTVIKEASKLVLSSLKGYMPLAVEINASAVLDGSKDEISKPEHLEVIHMLTLLKHIVPYLSVKVSLKVLQQLHKLMNSHFTALTRHIFSVIEAIFETSKAEVVILQAENIIKPLTSYVNMGAKNPNDTILSAASLLKSALDKLQTGEVSKWIDNLPLVFDSIAGLLTSEASTASQASNTLKELINFHIRCNCLTIDNESVDDEVKHSMESSAVKSTCAIFENVLSSCGGVPNEQSLAVISALFRKLGEISYFYMKGTILKLADIMTLACRNKSDTKHLQECIGSAVIAIGPEKILALLPINPNAEDPSCSNVWLIPILRNYVVGSSLGFFMEHVVPLAESFQRICAKVKKSVIQEELQAYARGCWGLLPAFCRHPTDTYQNFGSLVKLLVTFITKDSFMLENIAIALQELVNQNKTVVRSNEGTGEFATLPKTSEINGSSVVFKSKPPYSKKIASRNIRALASCAGELVQALVDVFFDSPPEKRAYLKDAIGCLASITDSSVTKSIFISSLERFQLINDLGEFGKQGSHISASADQEQGNITPSEKGTKRCLTVELASSLVEGASEDMIASIFDLIKHTLQESDEVGQTEAYHTLSRILEEHSWFCSSHINELMDFLIGLKSPVVITTVRSRFACLQILLVHTIEGSLDEENSKAFLVLNEIILTIKDSTEEARKAAYDLLIGIHSSLQRFSSAASDEPYQKLINMIMGYLSGSSPHIKSGAVSALSVLVHNNAEICLLIPDLVPTVLALLQTKAVEVIKAVLGFVKVLVSSHQANDLQNFLPDIINGVLSWSSISRHHFREKVTIILEIMMRKCGVATVESLAPEKHKNFVKSVMANRHGKTGSKETGTTDQEPKVSESSPRGRQRKRKHSEFSTSSEDGGKMEPRERMWEKKHKGFIPSKTERMRPVKEDGNSYHDRKGQSQGSARNKTRNFNRRHTESRNTQAKQTKVSKKFGVTKSAEHKKVGRKQQKY